jgi:pimeloyl-ACP methyl ester carboxylesterase
VRGLAIAKRSPLSPSSKENVMSPHKVRSLDGTEIAFETTGSGAPLILVGGAFNDRRSQAAGAPLAALLADRFTVYSYDRRGRGGSSDTTPYATAREVEDLAAVISAANDAAFVFGHSSGALLAFDAAAQRVPISKLVLHEPPLIFEAERAQALAKLADQLDETVKANRREEAVELFLQAMGLPKEQIEQLRKSSAWPGEQLAHTLSYDLRLAARGASRLEQAKTVSTATLAVNGGASPAWMRESVKRLAHALPAGRHVTLEGQTHTVDPRLVAATIAAFLID